MKLISAFLVFCMFSFFPEISFSADVIHMIALGDSTTAGTPYFQSPIESPPKGSGDFKSPYVYWMMERYPNWNIQNWGVAGERVDEILKRFVSSIQKVEEKPSFVIVLAGVNDLYQGYSVDWVTDYLKKIYESIQKNKIKVIACTILPFNSATEEVRKRIKKVNDWIRTYSTEQGFAFCDTYAAAENPNQPGELLGSQDGLHPDPETYKKIGNALTETLENELKLKN